MSFPVIFSDPINAVFAMISIWLVAVLLIELQAARLWRQRQISQRIDALMLAHKAYHAEGGGTQTANDNQHKYSIQHRFISSDRI